MTMPDKINDIVKNMALRYGHIVRQINESYVFAHILPNIRAFLFNSRFSRYVRDLWETMVEAAILLGVVYVLCAVMLHVASMMWHLYQETIVGHKFLVTFHEKAAAINAVMDLNFWLFAGEIALSAFIICIGVSAVCRFLHISRYLYLSQGFFSKLIFWGLPLSAVVAYQIFGSHGFQNPETVFIISAVPTFCLFMSCFNYTEKLLPELGEVLSAISGLTKQSAVYIKRKMDEYQ